MLQENAISRNNATSEIQMSSPVESGVLQADMRVKVAQTVFYDVTARTFETDSGVKVKIAQVSAIAGNVFDCFVANLAKIGAVGKLFSVHVHKLFKVQAI